MNPMDFIQTFIYLLLKNLMICMKNTKKNDNYDKHNRYHQNKQNNKKHKQIQYGNYKDRLQRQRQKDYQ